MFMLIVFLIWTRPFLRPHCKIFSTLFYPCAVQIINAWVNEYYHSFVPFTGKVCKSVPSSAWPPSNDLNVVTRGVSRHFTNRISLSFLELLQFFLCEGDHGCGECLFPLCLWVALCTVNGRREVILTNPATKLQKLLERETGFSCLFFVWLLFWENMILQWPGI